ncbi:MAG: tyrosine-type recombinase/integrase [Chloroflexi bacterium]|nr:tyrosine-type recombinase/integrase [Chloroflexota bacterium]
MNAQQTVERFLRECELRGLSPKTLEAYRWATGKLLAKYQSLPTDSLELMELIGSQKQLGDESRYDLWRVLRRFYRWASKALKLPNPMEDVEAPRRKKKRPRTLEESEILKILAKIPSRRDRAMVALALDTGIRLGELAGLRWQDVTRGALQVDGKMGPRAVPLSEHVQRLLVGLGDGDHIWMGRKGPLTRWGVKLAIRRALYRAGYQPPKAGPHMLRHSFGRHYIMAGGDVFSLQRIMGHSSLSTTMLYVTLNDEDLRRQHAKFSPLRLVEFDETGESKEVENA